MMHSGSRASTPGAGISARRARHDPGGGSSRPRHRGSERAWTNYFSIFVNALILGSTYALLGIGLTLIFGIMRVVNFTHGELYALGAYAVFFLDVSLGVNFFLALVVAVMHRHARRRGHRIRPAAAASRMRTSIPRCW